MTLDGFILHIFQYMHGIPEILQRILYHAKLGNRRVLHTETMNASNLCINRGTEGKEEMKAVMDADGDEQR